MRISVIALGKIGLPLAVQFASMGHDVIGVDIQQSVVDLVNEGVEPFPGEAELGDRLKVAVESGALRATTDYGKAVPGCDVVVVVVPLFVSQETWEPEFEWLDSATRSLSAHLSPGVLISYETTLPVGTTRTRWKPAIESISGLVEGVDFHLVFSPERVLTGRVFADLRRYPKLVGGLSPEGGRRAARFYESVLDFDERPDLSRPNGVWDLGSAEAAEMAKLAETTYRDVNIGLANQFARFAEGRGIDIYEVIDASNSQPYSHIHQPGIAVGGHCIPVYPRLYLWNDPEATVVRAAREANMRMPEHAVQLLAEQLGGLEGKTVIVLGASYRGGVKETAFSGIFATVTVLERFGASPIVHDPMFTAEELSGLGLTPYVPGTAAEGAILQADHPEYATWRAEMIPGLRAFVDGRNVTSRENWSGVRYVAIGRGSL